MLILGIMHIILVSVGNFQEYILDNITNLIEYGNKNIIVITEPIYFERFNKFKNITLVNANQLSDCGFKKKSRMNKSYRNGFWHLCSMRLVYIYTVMIQKKLTDCLHIENDVTIYCNLEETRVFNSNKVCCVFDTVNRVIPSVIYIPNSEAFKPVITNYDHTKIDMENLAGHDETIIEKLPIYIPTTTTNITNMVTKNYTKYGWIFDGAAIGQYLGGVDARNIEGDTRGFINETCVIKYNTNIFHWIQDDQTKLYRPYIYINDIIYPIFNLHIHSKKINNFMGTNPIETKLISKLN